MAMLEQNSALKTAMCVYCLKKTSEFNGASKVINKRLNKCPPHFKAENIIIDCPLFSKTTTLFLDKKTPDFFLSVANFLTKMAVGSTSCGFLFSHF
jgi:hypothetical protein